MAEHNRHLWNRGQAALAVLILITVICAPAFSQTARLTDRTTQALADSGPATRHSVWLYFDSTRLADTPINLTDKAILRRAKVDPDNHLIDKYDYHLAPELVADIESTGAVIRRRSRWLRAVSVEANRAQIETLSQSRGLKKIDLVNELEASPESYQRHDAPPTGLDFTPEDYGYSLTQNEFTHAVKLHAAGLSGQGVLLAFLDSGYDTAHPAFDSTSIVATWDFINDREDVTGADCPTEPSRNHQDDHGTATLGAAAGFIPGTLIGTGYGADYALAKTEITCGGLEIKVEEDNWIAAAEWADSLGADIITASLGYFYFQDTTSYTQDQLDGNTANITIAADIAASKNILVITSAGNERLGSWGTISFPADGDSVLAVGATYSDGTVADFSSPGPTADGRIKPDIATLGVSVYAPNGYAGGTSMSAPLVAGAASLALEHDPAMTAMELLALIRATGSRASSPNNDIGYGLYDAAASADIIKVDYLSPIEVAIDNTASVTLTSSGRSEIVPTLSLIEPVPGLTLTDLGNGTARLDMIGLPQNEGHLPFAVTADIGSFVDTTFLILTTYAQEAEAVRAGPNPFTDSVSFFPDNSTINSGSRFAVSVFNAAGEKVWEAFNYPASSADVLVWDGRNSYGNSAAPGVYLVHIHSDRTTGRLKLLKLK